MVQRNVIGCWDFEGCPGVVSEPGREVRRAGPRGRAPMAYKLGAQVDRVLEASLDTRFRGGRPGPRPDNPRMAGPWRCQSAE